MEDYIDLMVYVNNSQKIVKDGIATLREESAEYILNGKKSQNKQKTRKHHKHDKMFRKILNNEKYFDKIHLGNIEY